MTTPEDVERRHTLLTAVARFDELRSRETFGAVPIEPVTIEPVPIEPVPIEPVPIEPVPIEPVPIEPAPIEPAPTGPATGAERCAPAGALSRQEALELLALGEVIAREAGYGRQLAVRSARAAGASWAEVGAALGTTKQSAWEAHSRWVGAQVGS